MAQPGVKQTTIKFRLTNRDALSLRKLARVEGRTVSDLIRHLIARESAAKAAIKLAHAAEAR